MLLLILTALLCFPAPPHAQENTVGPQLVGTYPLTDAAFSNQIVFYFDRPLAPVNDPATLIQFDPPLEGVWAQGERHIALTVKIDDETTLPPQIYRATFLPALLGADGQAVAAPDSPLLFSNFRLTLDSFDYGEIGTETTELNLLFSAQVSWEQLQQHLQISDGEGTPVTHTAPRNAPATFHVLTVPTLANGPYRITLSPGLTDATGTFQTSTPITGAVPVKGPFSFESIEWEHRTVDKDQLNITLPHPLDREAFLTHFKVYPDDTDKPLTLESVDTENSMKLAYRFDRPAESYQKLRYAFSGDMDAIPVLFEQLPFDGTLLLSRNPLEIEYHNWNSEGAEPMRLELYFTGSVDAAEAEKYLDIQPPLANRSVQAGTHGSVDIYGDWQSRQDYKLLLGKGLTDRAGRLQLDEPLAWNPGAPPHRSGVGFAFETPYYFPRRTAGPLPVYGRNLKKATATLYELYPSNLVRALDQMDAGKSPGEFGYGLAGKVAEHDIDFSGPQNTRVERQIPLEGFMPADRKGIFGISLSPAYDYYSTKVLVWTDIGVLAHWQDNALLLYAHNLWELTPISGAKVTIYSHKHQVMGELTTNTGGVARLDNWDTELGQPTVAIVETADDFTFLPLKQRDEDPVTFTTAMPTYDSDGYDAFLYADRNLYRPGETMHLRWLVRDADGAPLTGAPLQLRLRGPKNERHEYTESLSSWGSASLDVEIAKDWLTGEYQVELWVPSTKKVLTTQTINIEDFVPNRLSAEVKTEAPYWLPGEEHPFTVHGDHLSGGPARERKTGAVVILTKDSWVPEQWKSYSFANDDPFKTDIRELGEGRTDGDGNATYNFTWLPPKNLTFPVTAILRGEVFEAGGRSVSARTQSILFPTDTLVGLAVANGAEANAVDVAVAAIHPDGRPAAVESVQVTLEKKRWRYYVRRYSSHNEANWQDDFDILSTHTVPLSAGLGSVALSIPSGYGTYRVKVHRDDSPQYATQSFWSYRGQANLSDASRPSLIELTPDKKIYTIGDTATVQITSPFDGEAIVVVQRDNLEELVTVPVVDGVGTLTLPLLASHYPNIWLQTTVIHPVEPGTALTYPYASFAMLNITVHDPAKALGVKMEGLPEVIRPLTTLPITIQVTNADGTPTASELTLALVDEGIHQILEYQNPDPVSWFQRPRRPDFRRAHYYDQVAYDFTGKPIGGGALLRKRLGENDSGVEDNWIKPLALWSGTVETDATGVATIAMDIPEFAGKVRLVTVATTGSEAGSDVANVTIRRPVVLQTTLPRFVAPGDTFEATAVVQNKEGNPVKTTLKVEGKAPLSAESFEQSWDIAGGGEVIVPVSLSAGEFPGSGTVQWLLSSTDPAGAPVDSAVIDTKLKVQAPSVFQSRGEIVVIPAGEQREFVNTEFKENEILEASLNVTPNPLARLGKALDYVVGYPYGCAEQTTSQCLPLFLLGQSSSKTGSDWDAVYYRQFIQAGIDRLVAMQTSSGGIGNWPGARDAYPYGSIYAAHFLTLARQDQAFKVPEEAHEKLMAYLRDRIPLDPSEGYMSLYNYAYTCYVRALNRDPRVMEDITSLDAFTVSTSTRQWLALAMLVFTDSPKQAQDYLLTRRSTPYDVLEQGDTLNSPVRNDAITLLIQMKLGVPGDLIHPQAEKLVRYLESHRYSTQEAAFVITALAEYLKVHVGDITQASASIATPSGVEERSGDFMFKIKNRGVGSQYTVANNGPTPLYVQHTRSGILVNPDVAAEANGITITRRFEGESGPVTADQLVHGKNYLVELEITCDEDFRNIAVVDLMPGGLDIENPRLAGSNLAVFKKSDGVQPGYVDVRDDRLIAAFDSLKQGTHHYYYAVRTVTPGTFRHPGATAECMYAVQFNGRTAGTEVTITR